MKKLHKKSINGINFVPEEAEWKFLFAYEELDDSSSFVLALSKDTINALEELGDVLKCIHRRMVSEGFEIIDGVVKKVC